MIIMFVMLIKMMVMIMLIMMMITMMTVITTMMMLITAMIQMIKSNGDNQRISKDCKSICLFYSTTIDTNQQQRYNILWHSQGGKTQSQRVPLQVPLTTFSLFTMLVPIK